MEVEREGEEKPSTKLQAIAEHDFESDNPKVLNFKANDHLILYSQASADWWKGSNDLLQDVLDKSQEIEVSVGGAMKKKKDSVIVGNAV